MNLLSKRKENYDDILKGRFIKKVLTEQGKEILDAQAIEMRDRGFDTMEFYSKRRFVANTDELTITNLTVHRFVDMKTRKTKDGVIRKKSHPIYNRIIYGHLNNIIRQISFGYSDAVIEEMKKLED